MFDLNASTIRFWESEFDVLRPRKGSSGNRLYTERDIRYLQVIYQLVKVKGYTLQGRERRHEDEIRQIRRECHDAQDFDTRQGIPHRPRQETCRKAKVNRIKVISETIFKT